MHKCEIYSPPGIGFLRSPSAPRGKILSFFTPIPRDPTKKATRIRVADFVFSCNLFYIPIMLR